MNLSNIRASSWIVTACLIILAAMGVSAFFWQPKDIGIVSTVLMAVGGVLNQVLGVKAGGSMPQQAGDAKPGQSSQTDTTTRVTAPDPAVLPDEVAK